MKILEFIQQFRNPFLDTLMSFVSLLADNGYIVILIGLILFIFKKFRIISVKLAAALVIGVLITNITLKPLIDRPRPCDVAPIQNMIESCPLDGSFPSGHTTAIFGAATVIYLINKKFGVYSYAFAFLVGFSRMYMYEHFPGDVLGGILVGIIAGISGTLIVNYLYPKIKGRWIKKLIPKTY